MRKVGKTKNNIGSQTSVPLFDRIVSILEQARVNVVRAVNSNMVIAYWLIGREIVEELQGGDERAEYGTESLKKIAIDLTARYGRGFGWRNLYQMRQFYITYQNILQKPSAKIQIAESSDQILQKPSAKLHLTDIVKYFPLPWSHYVRLLSVRNPEAREFYEAEALRGGWSEPQLDRQISSMFYERTALSKNKAAMLRKGAKALDNEILTPEEELKSPLVLEFLGLRDEYSESDLEGALIHHIETFLLELGSDFAFVGRQRRLRIDDSWYRIDLMFFHRKLRCLILIDLKLGKLTHADAGQMHLYLNYAKANWTNSDENPPVGLILCAGKGQEMARYALENLPNKVLVAEYQTVLPDEKILVEEISKTRRILEQRKKR